MSQTQWQRAMQQTIEKGDLAQFKQLLNVNVNVNTPIESNGWTALCYAVEQSRLKFVVVLLDRNADPNQPVSGGMAEGMVALSLCREVPIASRLIQAGARLDVHDHHGRTPLDWARLMRRKEMVAYLQSKA